MTFKLVGAASLVASGILASHFGDLLVLVGIAVAAAATWRSQSPRLTRAENQDLRDRLVTVEADRVRTLAEKTAAELELKSRPNLEQHAKLLADLGSLVTEQTGILREIHTAVVPPE